MKLTEQKLREIIKEELASLNEASRLSFRDAGITDTMDLKNAIDRLSKGDIDWNQKGQAFVFNNAQDVKKAKQLLELE